MQVFGPYRVHTSQPIQGPHRAGSANSQGAASRSTTPVDRLDLSEQARGAGGAAGSTPGGEAPIRAEKVAALRRAIAEGGYDTPDKLDIALERMLGDFS